MPSVFLDYARLTWSIHCVLGSGSRQSGAARRLRGDTVLQERAVLRYGASIPSLTMWPARQNRRPPMFQPLVAVAKAAWRPDPTLTTERESSSDSSDRDTTPRAGKGAKGTSLSGGQVCCTCSSHTRRRCGNTECKNPCCVVCIQTVPWATAGMCPYCARAAPQPNDDALAPPPQRSRSPWRRARMQRAESQRYAETRASASAHLYSAHERVGASHPGVYTMFRDMPHGKVMCPMCREYKKPGAIHGNACAQCWSCCRCPPPVANWDALNPLCRAPRDSVIYMASQMTH